MAEQGTEWDSSKLFDAIGERRVSHAQGWAVTVSVPLMKTPLSDSLVETLLKEGLPPPNTRRWVVRRKAAVVIAVMTGTITIEQACQVYQLTEEEFLSWKHALETHGFPGLRTTRIQQYRRLRSRRARH